MAFEDSTLVGILELREGKHVSMLFIHNKFQRNGIGRALLSHVLDAKIRQTQEVVTVHSSPNAVDAYQALGFVPVTHEQVKNGIRFIRMRLQL